MTDAAPVGEGVADRVVEVTGAGGAAASLTGWHAVPALPTVSEVWLRLLDAYGR